MAHKGSTPEEQLLNLIEKGDSAKSERLKEKKSFLSSAAILTKLSPFTRLAGSAVKKIKIDPNLEFVNKVLAVLCVLLLSYSIFDFIFNSRDVEKFYNKAAALKFIKQEEKDIVTLQPFLYYLTLAQRRNIFSPVELMKDLDESKERKKLLQDLLSDLTMVGVSLGEEPQAMIESKKANQTYFLKKGDTINGLKIEEILTNKVILSYEGEKGELI